MDYSKVVAVTNRHLCVGDYIEQIRCIAQLGVSAIIVREKDLKADEYLSLFGDVIAVCEEYGIRCIPHTYWEAADMYRCRAVHIPLERLQELQHNSKFEQWRTGTAQSIELGSSVHSVQQAQLAVQLGVSYITAGHVFATDCKKGLEPRGLSFLKDICESVAVPVYAIGGIDASNYRSALMAGADKVCIMSGMMTMQIEK